MPKYFCVVKILTVPKTLNSLERTEFNRLYKDSDVPELVYQALNPNLSEIKYVYRCIFEVHHEENYVRKLDKHEKVESISEFFEFLEKHQSKSMVFAGYGLLRTDLPRLNYEIIKTQRRLHLFDTKMYTKLPSFDIMSWIYCWGYSQSLLLTAKNFGVPVAENLAEEDFIQRLYTDDDPELYKGYLMSAGSTISDLFEKVYSYYF